MDWVSAGQKKHDLLYVSNVKDGLVNVYDYQHRTLVGILTGFTSPRGECANAAGDVYITDAFAGTITEYEHGGKKPLQVLADDYYEPLSCAVDHTTGNLAVANSSTYSNEGGNLAIYPGGTGKPVFYGPPSGGAIQFGGCAYDDHGNLFTSAGASTTYQAFYYYYYLPKKSTQLRLISISAPGSSQVAGTVAFWDGQYWVVVSDNKLYRYSIGTKAHYIDAVVLSGAYSLYGQLSIYQKHWKSLGSKVVGAAGNQSQDVVAYWDYPAGGDPIATITKPLDEAWGITISLGEQ